MKRLSKGRLGIGTAICLSTLVLGSGGCSSVRAASFDHEVYVIKGVCKIRFGSAGLNWLLLQAGVSSVDVTPEPGAQLASASMRIFEDANGNGAFDSGEKQKSFQSTTTPNGLSFTNVSVSASDVAGWNTDSVQCSVEVTDTAGKLSVWTHPI